MNWKSKMYDLFMITMIEAWLWLIDDSDSELLQWVVLERKRSTATTVFMYIRVDVQRTLLTILYASLCWDDSSTLKMCVRCRTCFTSLSVEAYGVFMDAGWIDAEQIII